MSESAPTSPFERLVSLVGGGLILLLAVAVCGWASHWAVAWLRNPAALPPAMSQVLLAASLCAAVVGLGAWRILRLAVTGPVLGLPLGGLVLAMLALGAAVGALVS